MLALHDLFNTPLYENFGITIHPQWLAMFLLSMQTNINVSCDIVDESCDHNNEDRFEEEQEDILWCKTYYLLNKYTIILKMLYCGTRPIFQTIKPFSRSPL